VVLILVVAAVVSLFTYVIAGRFMPRWKTTLAVCAFALFGLAPLACILYVGDQPPADAVTVTQEELRDAAGSAP
jgi:hypothetical protein